MPEKFLRSDMVIEGKTAEAALRLQKAGFYEEPDADGPSGYYDKPGEKRRLMIGRDTPINKGVYLGSIEREAIVVDDESDGLLHTAYGDLLIGLGRLRDQHQLATETILQEVYQLVMKKIPYNAGLADRIMEVASQKDGRVALGSYIASHGGVCRHEALLAGYLIERLIQDERIGDENRRSFGRVSVDRNAVRNKGGHAWVRYGDEKKQVWIIDAAQKYCGKLDDVSDEAWFYQRLPQKTKAALPAADDKRSVLSALRKLIGKL